MIVCIGCINCKAKVKTVLKSLLNNGSSGNAWLLLLFGSNYFLKFVPLKINYGKTFDISYE